MSLHTQRKAFLNTLFGIILFIVVGIFADTSRKSETKGIEISNNFEDTYVVSEIVDGDTIKVQKETEILTVRLIGINTPETKDPRKDVECFGQEASARLTSLIEGKTVRIVNDDSQEDMDRYNRLLRYVFLDDGTHINYQMIREGFAYEYTYSNPYKYQQEFIDAQSFAKNNSLGLWSPATCNGNL